MYKKIAPLDNFGFLWYHARVKLGCFATALSDLTGRKASPKNDSRLREMELASVFFRLFGVLDGRSCLACHTYVRAFVMSFSGHDGKNFRLKTVEIFALPLRNRRCPTAGKPDFGGRAGEVRSGYRICGMLTAATYPEEAALSRAVSQKFYQEEN